MASNEELLGEIFGVTDERVVVTGAASGIGRAIADVFARVGARVALADIDEDGLKIVADELADAGCTVMTAVLDITDVESVEALFERVSAAWGGVDVAFANAGGTVRGLHVEPEDRPVERYPEEAWLRGIEQNLTGAFATIRAAAGHMRAQRRGRIVVTCSTAGLRPDPYTSYDYSAAKAGLVNVIRHAALDLAPDGVRINGIAPGPFRTNIGGPHAHDPDVIARWSRSVPLGRMGNTSELRGLALLLGSEASSFMTGVVCPIDGGAMALSEPT